MPQSGRLGEPHRTPLLPRPTVPNLVRLMSLPRPSERPLLALLEDQVRATVTGRHRLRFLHAMTTADFNASKPGDVGFALMATANGRHVGQVRFEVETDAVQLVGRSASLLAVLDALKRHRVADDVRWTEPAAESIIALYGGEARTLVEAALGAAPAPGGFVDLAWNDVPVRASHVHSEQSELGREAVHLRLPLTHGPSLRVKLLAAGAEPLDASDWQRLRIEAGWPLDGIDLGAEDVALASERLAATVSWTKGCFLGQEVYVMARDRGELPKRLRGVLVPGPAAPPVHAELFAAAVPDSPPSSSVASGVSAPPKVQGMVGSFAPAPGGYLALAMLKRKAAEPGTELALADGRRVRVVALPGASSR